MRLRDHRGRAGGRLLSQRPEGRLPVGRRYREGTQRHRISAGLLPIGTEVMRQLTRHLPKLLAAVALSLGTTGCAGIVPKFDVPYDEHGVPTAQTIVHQITCELAQLIEDDS